ncbi:extracellular solute-binding protein [Candidatus Halobonum tyrrellensis]|uniref:ABC transporter substrate-binding protein n=1 Tax=Candidatus Halobonum tyrrellensis G22 TaxID=1324957 RepID=V4HIY9_9EURY|nr:extracellular solute-binding protein [Candidatus Halobonum tyrrellensis]ESP89753.1 ABC transporter substrate-binding protein [Candidatus Halobonum tyrrellensis G22]
MLSALGGSGFIALAGCASGGGGGGDAPTDSETGTGSSTPTGTPTATAAPDQITLDYWTLFAGGDGATMKEIVDTFNEENSNIQIRRQRIPWDQYYTKLYTSLSGGNPPDMCICHLSRIKRFGEAFEPLTDTLDESSYYSTSYGEGVVAGDLRSAPLDILGTGTYYNKGIFEEAGLDPEQTMGSWSEFKEKIDTVVSETDKMGYDPGGALHGNRVYYPWLRQMGNVILEETDNGWEMGFDNEDGLKVLQTVNDMRANWEWFPKDTAVAFEQFQNNGTAALNNGTWTYNAYKELDLEWGFMKAPPAPGMGLDENKTWSNSHSIAVPTSKNRSKEKTDAAKQAAKTITQDYGLLWGTSAGHIPNAVQARESQELREAPVWNKTMETWFEMLENDEFMYVPRTRKNGQYHQAIYDPVTAVRTGNMEPQQALDKIKQNLNSVWK